MKNTEQLVYEMLNPPKKKAAVAVVDSNIHREHILPSEKAFSYKMKMEGIKGTGQTHRFSLNDCTPFHAQSIRMKKLR